MKCAHKNLTYSAPSLTQITTVRNDICGVFRLQDIRNHFFFLLFSSLSICHRSSLFCSPPHSATDSDNKIQIAISIQRNPVIYVRYVNLNDVLFCFEPHTATGGSIRKTKMVLEIINALHSVWYWARIVPQQLRTPFTYK